MPTAIEKKPLEELLSPQLMEAVRHGRITVRRALRRAGHLPLPQPRHAFPAVAETFSIGQILVALWGYDQAEADFYEVTRLTARRVELRELNTVRGLTTRTPIPGSYASEPKLYRPLAGSADGIKINEHLAAFPWDGNPAHILTR